MPKTSLPILEAHWPEFLFNCSSCVNEDHCIEKGECMHQADNDEYLNDYEPEMKRTRDFEDDKNDFLNREVYGSLDRNFNERYHD